MNRLEEDSPGSVDLCRPLEEILSPERVLTRTIDRVAYANDASVYRLVPKGVVQPRSIREIQELFRFCHATRVPLTFRAAGTSLSGQAVTDGILVDLSRHWRGAWVEEDGARVSVVGLVAGGDDGDLGPDGVEE